MGCCSLLGSSCVHECSTADDGDGEIDEGDDATKKGVGDGNAPGMDTIPKLMNEGRAHDGGDNGWRVEERTRRAALRRGCTTAPVIG